MNNKATMRIKVIGVSLVLLVIAAQFFRPDKVIKNQTDITAFLNETQPSVEVQEILVTACFDCHSNNTKYPWYSEITPINFWMKDHIDEGTEELNFSDWASYSLKRKKHKMEEIWEEIEENEMPLNSYLITHSDAKLSEDEKSKMVSWAKKQFNDY